MTFFDMFQTLCAARGTTPTGVGRSLGISIQTISNWKKRGNVPNGQTVKKIADFLSVPVEMLIDPSFQVAQNLVRQLDVSGIGIDLSTIERNSSGQETVLVWPRECPDKKVRVRMSDLHHAVQAAGQDAAVAKTMRIRRELNMPPQTLLSTVIAGIPISPELAASVNIYDPANDPDVSKQTQRVSARS